MADAGEPTYLYHFTRVPPRGPATRLGAFHGLEIPYVFGLAPKLPGTDATDRALSAAMSGAWVRFAATGDPNGGALPAWQPWSNLTEACMYFGDEVSAGAAPELEACAILDALAAERLSAAP